VSGLGLSPEDVVINGGIRADARSRKGNATVNFWRDVENMSVVPAGGFDRWAVSFATLPSGSCSVALRLQFVAASPRTDKRLRK